MIADKILKEAGKKFRSASWYTNALMNELSNQEKDISQIDTDFIIPGDLVFFMYSAKYPQKYLFWDRQPLAYVINVNPRQGMFLGSKVLLLHT